MSKPTPGVRQGWNMFGRLLNLLWTPVETRIGVCLYAYTHFSLYLVYRGRPDVKVYVAKAVVSLFAQRAT